LSQPSLDAQANDYDDAMSLGMLPTSFVRNVTSAFPDGGRWLANLPGLLAECLRMWDLMLDGEVYALSFNYVVPVVERGKVAAVLKLGFPSVGFAAEVRALRAFQMQGAVRLLASDERLGALLLERVTPGNTLVALQDEMRATEIAARIMRNLWQARAVEGEFPSLESWTAGFAALRLRFSGDTGPLDSVLVDTAENLRAELLQGGSTSRLLHGDLHHFNVLNGNASGWIAIDPKGVIGDPAYEPAAFLLNPGTAVVLDRSMQQARIGVFAEQLRMDPQRIVRWVFVQAVLGAWWTIEDGGVDWDASMLAAGVLLSLVR
jgi:streptomycin 6-kinase